MRRLLLSALALSGAAALPFTAHAGDSAAGAVVMAAGKSYGHAAHHGGGHRWGHRIDGRWHAGHRAPGGWHGYRRPYVGYMLPRYWVQPSFYIASYRTYGLPAPAYGYGWSRYYDDAVLTDRYGRVYDSRGDVAWDRYEGGYADAPYGYGDGGYGAPYGYGYGDGGYGYGAPYRAEPKRDSGLGGAAIGGVAGGLLGNRIAGKGNRTVGTVMGAAVGAMAGAAIDKAEDSGRSRSQGYDPRGYDDERGYSARSYADAPPPRVDRPGPAPNTYPPYAAYDLRGPGDDGVTYDGGYSGRWVGTWYGDDGRVYSGEYRGEYQGEARGRERAPASGPHWSDAPPPPSANAAPLPPAGAMPPHAALPYGYGYGYGYGYAAPAVVTTVVQPAVVTTTTYIEEEVVYSRPAKRVVRKAKPRPKVRCVCR